MPEWILKLHKHSFPGDHDSCPTYAQVAQAVNRCKTRASACPLDQLSIIILKRCPILRPVLHRIIHACWTQGVIPECWKRGCTILIYKKGSNTDPENFRPITNQCGTKFSRPFIVKKYLTL